MDMVVEHAISDMMIRVKSAEIANSGGGPLHFFFTLSRPVEIEAGPEILRLFERQLAECYPEADVECSGYVSAGYNIKATVLRK